MNRWRVAAVYLVALATPSAWGTTGISALGALQSVLIYTLVIVQCVFAVYFARLAASKLAGDEASEPSALAATSVGVNLVCTWLLYFAFDATGGTVLLGLLLIFLSVAVAYVASPHGIASLLSTGITVLCIVGVLAAFPHAISLHDRKYRDNRVSDGITNLQRESYWRAWRTRGGLRYLDERPHAWSERHQPLPEPFPDEVSVKALEQDALSPDKPEWATHAVAQVTVTRGPWGWTGRPDTEMSLPLFGERLIYKYKLKPLGFLKRAQSDRDWSSYHLYEIFADASHMSREVRLEWLRRLRSRGVALDYAEPETGQTTLMAAVAAGDHEAVLQLVRYGADLEATRKDGQSARDLVRKGDRRMLALLDGSN